jgi:hypothetical protein
MSEFAFDHDRVNPGLTVKQKLLQFYSSAMLKNMLSTLKINETLLICNCILLFFDKIKKKNFLAISPDAMVVMPHKTGRVDPYENYEYNSVFWATYL